MNNCKLERVKNMKESVRKPSRVLGVNRTTDASIAVIDEAQISFLARKERIFRNKHARGELHDLKRYLPLVGTMPFDVIVECYSSDLEREKRSLYREEIVSELPLTSSASIIEISHHFSHALLANLSGFQQAAVLVADHHGSPLSLIGPSPIVEERSNDSRVEVISTYSFADGILTPLSKQTWDMKRNPICGLGAFYSFATKTLFGQAFREGVLTGLAAYGDPSCLKMSPLIVRDLEVHIPEDWMNLLYDSNMHRRFFYNSGNFVNAANFAASVQLAFEEALLTISHNLRKCIDVNFLVYVGGCAMNCSANARLEKEGGFSSIFIPPACDDGGSAIGCAIFGNQAINKSFSNIPWEIDYLGPPCDYNVSVMSSKAVVAGHTVVELDLIEDRVANYLATGQVIALWQGRSEIGARALGNRSIIADPRFDVMRWYINSQVKGREWFRPLAPAVIESAASKYFIDAENSPFMLKRKRVRPEFWGALQAVTHYDHTARIQTVNNAQNPFLCRILEACARNWGFPIVLNTSFNGRNEPIVESFDDALKTFSTLPIHHLLAPPLLISKAPQLPSVYVS